MSPLTYTIDTAPAATLVTLEAQKKHMYVDHNDDDDYIQILINLAERYTEIITQRYLGTQSWTLSIDAFPVKENGLIQILRNPVQSITAINYLDTDGNSQLLATSEYVVDSKSAPCRIVQAEGSTYPGTKDTLNAVTITFDCGYDTIKALNEQNPAIAHAVKLIAAEWYENREDAQDVRLESIPHGAAQLLSMAGVHTYT
tara:strand:- start:11150 stop:11749 length:600 start_codon:yes stop_codon:yes gene_type:complete